LIAEGAIGEPAVVRASFHFAMYPERRALPDVRVQKDLDGGAFMDVGCYALNAARFLFDAEPIEVTALQRVDPTHGVDSTFAGILRFPGDRLALIDGGFDVQGPSRYEITGFGGAITAELAFQPDPARAFLTITRGGERTVEEIPGVDQYGLEADHFVQSVSAGRLLPPAEDGLAQARALEALYRSAESGQAVRLS
jgi:predicted dehydrogenase